MKPEIMKAVWLEDGTVTFRDTVAVPETPTGEARVRVRLAGVCSTDLELVKGYYPFKGIPGHEFVGEIVEAPDCPGRVGERVVGEINAVCGRCRACRRGRSRHCEYRTVLGILGRNGAFAEYLVLPLNNLIAIPDSIPNEIAVFTEPLAAALEISEQVRICPTDRVLVLGAGRLGQLIAQSLSLTACELTVAARHTNQKALLSSFNIPWLEEGAVAEREYDVAIEATGAPDGFSLARRAVRPGGTIILKSTYSGNLKIDMSSIVVDEITIVGSRCGPFLPALRLFEKKQIDPTNLIEKQYGLENAAAAFGHAAEPGALKVLLKIT